MWHWGGLHILLTSHRPLKQKRTKFVHFFLQELKSNYYFIFIWYWYWFLWFDYCESNPRSTTFKASIYANHYTTKLVEWKCNIWYLTKTLTFRSLHGRCTLLYFPCKPKSKLKADSVRHDGLLISIKFKQIFKVIYFNYFM